MSKKIFIVEPNSKLNTPYSFLRTLYPNQLSVERFDTIEKAMIFMSIEPPRLVMLSASFSAEQQTTFLEFLKNKCDYSIVPVIMMVDLSHPLNTMLGTTWGDRMGVTCSISTIIEFKATFERVTHGLQFLK